jgi:hypothetical protein
MLRVLVLAVMVAGYMCLTISSSVGMGHPAITNRRTLCSAMTATEGGDEFASSSEVAARSSEPRMKVRGEAVADFPPAIDLDTQLIDPWSDTPECRVDTPSGCVPGLESFKRLAREDYYSAETIWAGLVCSLGVGIGMQMVRAVISASAVPAEPELITGYFLNPAAAAAAVSMEQLSQAGL